MKYNERLANSNDKEWDGVLTPENHAEKIIGICNTYSKTANCSIKSYKCGHIISAWTFFNEYDIVIYDTHLGLFWEPIIEAILRNQFIDGRNEWCRVINICQYHNEGLITHYGRFSKESPIIHLETPFYQFCMELSIEEDIPPTYRGGYDPHKKY